MHDIKALEEKWNKYNKKKYKPFYLLAFVLLALAGFVFLYMKPQATKKVVLAPSVMPSSKLVNHVSMVQKTPIVPTKVVKHAYNNLLLNSPVLQLAVEKKEIMKEKVLTKEPLEAEDTEVEIPTLPVVHDIPVIDNNVIQKNNYKPKHKIKSLRSVKKNVSHRVKRKKKHLKIVKSSNKIGLKDVARRFKKYRNVEDGLFLAKTYYKQGKYLKSEYWALETNKIDYNIEDSWIVFAKSKIKLGQKREAISILNKYLKQSHSNKARKLLLKLKY